MVDAAGFTTEWVRASGLQQPLLVRGYSPPAAYLQPLLGPDMKDLVPLSRALGEDREVWAGHWQGGPLSVRVGQWG